MAFGIGIGGVKQLATAPAGAVEAASVLKALGRIYTHHGRGQHGLQLAEDGLAKSGRATAYNATHYPAHTVGIGPCREYFGIKAVGRRGFSNSFSFGLNAYATRGKELHGEGTGHHTSRGLSCRSPATAAVVANTILCLIGIVCMVGTVGMAELLVIGTADIRVLYYEGYGRAECLTLIYA